MLLVPRMPVARRLVRAVAGTASALRRTVAAAHGALLEAGARLLRNTRAAGRLIRAGLLGIGGGSVEFFMTLAMLLAHAFGVLLQVLFAVTLAVGFPIFGRSLSGQSFLVHFIRDGVGFFRGALMIVLVVCFVIFFRVGFLIGFVIGVQRFLQLFQFSGLDKGFGHGFDGFGALFGVSLRFFALGLDQLLGERADFRIGKARSIRSVGFRSLRLASFHFRSVCVARDLRFR